MPLVIVRKRDGRLMFANEPFRACSGSAENSLDAPTPEQFYADAAAASGSWPRWTPTASVDGLEQTLRRMDGTTFPARDDLAADRV